MRAQCVLFVVLATAATTSSTPTTQNGSDSSVTADEKPPECFSHTKIRYPSNCHKYWQCAEDSHGVMTAVENTCPDKEFFNDRLLKCIPEDPSQPCKRKNEEERKQESGEDYRFHPPLHPLEFHGDRGRDRYPPHYGRFGGLLHRPPPVMAPPPPPHPAPYYGRPYAEARAMSSVTDSKGKTTRTYSSDYETPYYPPPPRSYADETCSSHDNAKAICHSCTHYKTCETNGRWKFEPCADGMHCNPRNDLCTINVPDCKNR